MILDLKIGDKVFCKNSDIVNFFGKNDDNVFNLSIKKNKIYEIINIYMGFYVNYIYIKVSDDDIEKNTVIFITYNYKQIKNSYDTIDEFSKKYKYDNDYYKFDDYFITKKEYRKIKLEKISEI